MSGDYALITGGSQGIGRAFAMQFAHRGVNLLLVALPDDHLRAVRSEIIKEHEIQVHTLGIDLTGKDAPATIYQYCCEKKLLIRYLVNNAGIGDGGLFWNLPLERYHVFMDLNNRAMIGLTHLFVKDLMGNAPSYIVNASSIEATLPLPYKAVYTATKNFVYSFSLALNEELRGTGVHVSVLCPGPVITNEAGLVRYHSHGWRAKLVVKLPDQVAEVAVRKMLKGKTIIVPGFINRLIVAIANLMPEMMKMRILERVFRVYRNHHSAETH